MPQITIDIQDETLHRIRRLAASHGLPFEEEAKNLLDQAAERIDALPQENCGNLNEWRAQLETFRKKVGPIQSDSTEDIREMRDNR